MTDNPLHNILVPLNLPTADIQLRRNGPTAEVFDPLRQKWVCLTPEEWVRQNFVSYMVDVKGYPRLMLGNEVGLKLNNTLRRCDTVVMNREGMTPLMVIEYKAPGVSITQRVFEQIARYNMVLCARWLVVSNGLQHYCCRMDDDGRYQFVSEIPSYAEAQKK